MYYFGLLQIVKTVTCDTVVRALKLLFRCHKGIWPKLARTIFAWLLSNFGKCGKWPVEWLCISGEQFS